MPLRLNKVMTGGYMSLTQTSKSDEKTKKILSLGNKSFFLQPECLVRYLRQLPITEMARQVFWWHWGIAYRQKTLSTQLSIASVADALHVSHSAVSAAYQQLVDCHLIVRHQCIASHGGYGTAETIIDLPYPVLRQLLAGNQDRSTVFSNEGSDSAQNTANVAVSDDENVLCTQNRPIVDLSKLSDATNDGEWPSTNSVEKEITADADHEAENGNVEIPIATADKSDSSASVQTLEQEIEALNEKIAHWNAVAVECANANDLDGLRDAAKRVELTKTRKAERLEPLENGSTTPPLASGQVVTSSHTSTATSQPNPTIAASQAVPDSIPPARRELASSLRQNIFDRVAAMRQVSDPRQVTQEIIYSVEQGSQAKLSLRWGINAALKLVRENRWRTPYGIGKRLFNTSEYPYPLNQGTPFPEFRVSIER